jgi:hypothetical protein
MNTRLFLTNVNTLFRESAERDRGDMTIQNLAVIVLIAAITASIFATGIPGRVAGGIEEAICRILHLGGLVADCHPAVLPPIAGPSATPRPTAAEPSPGLTTFPTAQPTGQPTQPQPQPSPGPSPTGPAYDPGPTQNPQPTPHSEVPTNGCIRGMDGRYLEETFVLSRKVFGVRTSSRGYMVIRQVVGPDGKVKWEVSDYTWGEGAAWAGADKGGDDSTVSAKVQAWLGGMVTNGHTYDFNDEKSARDFYDKLAQRRIGGYGVKFTLRTNPITGGSIWAIGKIPGIGGWFSKFMGSKEPDQPSSSHWTEEGLTGGAQIDVNMKLAGGTSVTIPMKGRGWVVGGTRTTDSGPDQGDVTTYRRDNGEAEASVQFGSDDLMKYAPGGKWTSAAALAAIEAITLRLQNQFHQHIVIPPALVALIKKSPDIAINIKRKVGTTDALTVDKNGYGKSFSRTEDSQWNFYVRVGASHGIGGSGKVSGNVQNSLYATRTIATKTLDLRNPNDYDFFRNWSGSGDDGALDAYLQGGGGNESQLNFDAGVHSGKLGINDIPALKGLLQFELNTESETDRLVDARYYKPGTGWVTWQQCLTG